MVTYFSTLGAVSILLMAYGSKTISHRVKSILYFMVTAVLLCVAGFRYYVGTDYGQYVLNYSKYQVRDIALLNQPALAIIARLSAWIHNDYATWFFLMSAITVLPVMRTIYKESCCVWLSVIMYMFLCCWHFPFNIVKQGAAATILFAAYPFLRDRKFWKWSLLCILASTFHVTAILMIPVYFIAVPRITKMQTVLILCVGVVVLLSYDYLFEMVEVLKQGEGVLSEQSNLRVDNVNILRIIVHCMPTVIYVLFHKHYTKNTGFSSLFNLSLLNTVLNIGSMSSIYLNRFCNYTIIFNVLFIPMLFQPIKKKRSAFWILPLALLFYFVFWAYDLYKGSRTVNYYWIFER